MMKFSSIISRCIAFTIAFSLLFNALPLYAMTTDCTLDDWVTNGTHHARYSCPTEICKHEENYGPHVGIAALGAVIGFAGERIAELLLWGIKWGIKKCWEKYKEHKDQNNSSILPTDTRKTVGSLHESDDVKYDREDLKKERSEALHRQEKKEKKREKIKQNRIEDKEKKRKEFEDGISFLKENIDSLGGLIKEQEKQRESQEAKERERLEVSWKKEREEEQQAVLEALKVERDLAEVNKNHAEQENIKLMEILNSIQNEQINLREDIRKKYEDKELRKQLEKHKKEKDNSKTILEEGNITQNEKQVDKEKFDKGKNEEN